MHAASVEGRLTVNVVVGNIANGKYFIDIQFKWSMRRPKNWMENNEKNCQPVEMEDIAKDYISAFNEVKRNFVIEYSAEEEYCSLK